MTHKIGIVLLITCAFSCRSWTEDIEEKPERPDYLLEMSELVLDASACDSLIILTDLIYYPHCFFRSVCDDGYVDSNMRTTSYEFTNECDTVQTEWFSVIVNANQLSISVQPNDSTVSRQFRILYMIIPEANGLVVTQRGNEHSLKTK